MGLKKTAKATDIKKFGYSIKDVKIATREGRLNGFENELKGRVMFKALLK